MKLELQVLVEVGSKHEAKVENKMMWLCPDSSNLASPQSMKELSIHNDMNQAGGFNVVGRFEAGLC